MLTTILLLVFITIKMDCERLEKDIASLDNQNQIITDNIHSLKMKENHLVLEKQCFLGQETSCKIQASHHELKNLRSLWDKIP